MFYVRVLAWGVIATVCRNWTVTVGSEQVLRSISPKGLLAITD